MNLEGQQTKKKDGLGTSL